MFKLLLFNFIIVNVCAFKVFFFFMWKHSVKCSPRFYVVFMCVCLSMPCLPHVYVCLPVHAMFTTVLMWRAEGGSWRLVFFFYHVASGDWDQVLRLGTSVLMCWVVFPSWSVWNFPMTLPEERPITLSLSLSLFFFLRINLCFMK